MGLSIHPQRRVDGDWYKGLAGDEVDGGCPHPDVVHPGNHALHNQLVLGASTKQHVSPCFRWYYHWPS